MKIVENTYGNYKLQYIHEYVYACMCIFCVYVCIPMAKRNVKETLSYRPNRDQHQH